MVFKNWSIDRWGENLPGNLDKNALVIKIEGIKKIIVYGIRKFQNELKYILDVNKSFS